MEILRQVFLVYALYKQIYYFLLRSNGFLVLLQDKNVMLLLLLLLLQRNVNSPVYHLLLL